MMKVTYDPEADALYIELKDAEAYDNIDVASGVTADLDRDGQIIAIEILGASKRLGPDAVKGCAFTRVDVEQAAATI
jgi:uncharacterized protein YuzE